MIMNTLKERFDHYAPHPDDKIWEEINSTLAHRVVRRRWITATSSVAAVGVGVTALLFALNNGKPATQIADSSDVIVAENGVNAVSQQTVVTDKDIDVASQQASEPDAIYCNFGLEKDEASITVAEAGTPATEKEAVSEQASQSQVVEQTTVQPAVVEKSKQEVATPTSESKKVAEVQQNAKEEKTETKKSEPRINTKVPPSELVVWIPNAFSPDDPVEESARTFKVFPNTEASIRSFEIFIYSRSGRLVYHSKDYNEGWDGTANGQKQPMGTYVYVIEINDAVKGLQHSKGSITLIR